MSMRCKNLLLGGLCLIMQMGCGHREGSVASAPNPQVVPTTAPTTQSAPQTLMVLPPSVRTFHSNPPAIEFEYPNDWVADKAATACFAIRAPGSNGYSSMCLDIPKLPWHMAEMMTVNMVADGYISDLKKNQIHDAVVKAQSAITVSGCAGQRIICAGHANGKPAMDIAVILIHADRIYILSADSDDIGYDAAGKTLDGAIASWKWIK